MRYDLVTLFPDMFGPVLREGVVGRAVQSGLIQVGFHDPRDHGLGNYRQVDDAPYGGGAGMVMRPEPLFAAIASARAANPGPAILLTPQGARFDQAAAARLSALPGFILVCGRYEGVDERVRIHAVDEEISLGDFVLSGGEPAAICVIDAVSRLIEGVVGDPESLEYESFSSGGLEYPHYTRPPDFKGWKVPEVLLSGDHAKIRRWREDQALERTRRRRPDLLSPVE